MIVAGVACQISIQVLNAMVDMLICGDFSIVAVCARFAVFLSAILGDLGNGEYRSCGHQVKAIWSI